MDVPPQGCETIPHREGQVPVILVTWERLRARLPKGAPAERRDCRTARLPNGATAERRNCRTAQLPNGATAERRNCRTAQLPNSAGRVRNFVCEVVSIGVTPRE